MNYWLITHRKNNLKKPWWHGFNGSIILKITYENHRFLLTGDIEGEAEAQLVQSGKDLRSDVLKVPHHGSRTSSTGRFVEAVKPSHALFTVGFRNIFNLPSPKVLNRYERAGCLISRTDRDGAVMFETDGENLRVTTFFRPSAPCAQEPRFPPDTQGISAY